MSVVPLVRALPRACRWVLVPVALAAGATALAQEPPGLGEDPAVVVTRTVQPRIAYRGVPREQNPVHAQATVFPARVFHDTLGGVLGRLVGDEALGQTGSAGVTALAGLPALTGTAGALDPRAGLIHSPAAASAGQAAALGRVTGGLGATITGAVTGVLPGLAPAGADGGAGR